MNCKVCGFQLTGNESICPKCGTLIDHSMNTAPVAAPAVPVPEAPVAPAAPVVPTAPVVEAPVPSAPIPEAPIVEAPVAPVVEAPMPSAPIPEAPIVEAPVAPVVEPTPVAPAIPEAPVVPVAAPAAVLPEVSQPTVQPQPEVINGMAVNPFTQPTVSMNQYQNPTAMPGMSAAPQEPVKQKKQVNVKFIIFMVVGIALIVFLLYWTYVVQADPEEPETPVEPSAPTEVVDETVTYKGYTFTVPEGYTLTTTDLGGVITNGENTYTVEIDYTNKLDAYKTKLDEAYPDKKDTMTKTISNREYYIVDVKQDESNASMYVTKTTDEYVITGFVANKEFSQITDEEYNNLTTILDSATVVEDYDTTTSTFGKDGVKLLIFDKTKLS